MVGACVGHMTTELFNCGVCVCQRVHTCTILREGVVTDLVWDEQGSRIFFGDELGRVAVSYLPKVGVLYMEVC